MSKLFLLVLACCSILVGCGRKQETSMAVIWYPPSTLKTYPVTVEGYYTEPDGKAHYWGTLCRMQKVNSVYSPDEYWCKIAVPPGSDVVWSIKYSSPSAPGGFCWTFDHSTDKPCGGNGKNVGTVVFSYRGRDMPVELVSNGAGSQKPPLYFNARSALPR